MRHSRVPPRSCVDARVQSACRRAVLLHGGAAPHRPPPPSHGHRAGHTRLASLPTGEPASLASADLLLPRWLPDSPDLRGAPPRSWSPAALAFLGDAVWELYARRFYFAPARLHATYVAKVTSTTRAEAQAAVVSALSAKGLLTEAELGIVKWGRNAHTGKVPERLRANGKLYREATSLEVLVGYLYVSDRARLDDLMGCIGWDAAVGGDVAVAEGEAEAEM